MCLDSAHSRRERQGPTDSCIPRAQAEVEGSLIQTCVCEPNWPSGKQSVKKSATRSARGV